MGRNDADSSNRDGHFSRRKALKASLTALGAVSASGFAGVGSASDPGKGRGNGNGRGRGNGNGNGRGRQGGRALCADGKERSATEISLPDEVTPVSELPALEGVPHVLEIGDGTGDGERVENPGKWRKRRPELEDLFRKYTYGYAPPAPERAFEVEVAEESVLDGAATLKRVTIRFPELPDDAPTIRLDVFVPREKPDPSAVIFGLNMFGNHVVADIESLAYPAPTRQGGSSFFPRGALAAYWNVQATVERGYAFATACTSDFDASSLEMDLSAHVWQHRGDAPDAIRGGALADWAWGVSRCLDYLSEDCDIRQNEIAAFGHSRAGKATLLAGATDERIGLTIPHQSGAAGVALNRLDETPSSGETVGDIAGTFPNWFTDYYPEFAGQVERFPVDQHHLVGLVAPRAILASESSPAADTWTNPEASLESIRRASRVWELLGNRSIDEDDVYQEGGSIPEDAPPVMHYRRDVGHTMTPEYWEAIYDFADQHLRHGNRGSRGPPHGR